MANKLFCYQRCPWSFTTANTSGNTSPVFISGGAWTSGTSMGLAPNLTGGTISDVSITVLINIKSAASSTIGTKKNATTTGNVSISVAGAATGVFSDHTHSDVLSAGDYLALTGTSSDTTHSINLAQLCWIFDGGSNRFVQIGWSDTPVHFAFGGTNCYYTIYGNNQVNSSSDDYVRTKMRAAGALKNLSLNITTNTNVSNATTVKVSNAGVDTSLALSYAAAATGVISDTTHSATVAAGDTMGMHISMPGGANFTGSYHSIEYWPTNLEAEIVCMTGGTGVSVNTSTTAQMPPGFGYSSFLSSGTHNGVCSVAGTLKKFDMYIVTNAISAASTVKVNKNASLQSAPAISVTANTTGYFSDTSTNLSTAANDEFFFSITTAASGTTMTIGHMGCIHDETPAAASIALLMFTIC